MKVLGVGLLSGGAPPLPRLHRLVVVVIVALPSTILAVPLRGGSRARGPRPRTDASAAAASVARPAAKYNNYLLLFVIEPTTKFISEPKNMNILSCTAPN